MGSGGRGDEPVADGAGDRGLADGLVPRLHGHLAPVATARLPPAWRFRLLANISDMDVRTRQDGLRMASQRSEVTGLS